MIDPRYIDEAITTLQSLKSLNDPPPEAIKHLNALYCKIWPEACYDAATEHTEKFARELLPHIKALNDIFHFKR